MKVVQSLSGKVSAEETSLLIDTGRRKKSLGLNHGLGYGSFRSPSFDRDSKPQNECTHIEMQESPPISPRESPREMEWPSLASPDACNDIDSEDEGHELIPEFYEMAWRNCHASCPAVVQFFHRLTEWVQQHGDNSAFNGYLSAGLTAVFVFLDWAFEGLQLARTVLCGIVVVLMVAVLCFHIYFVTCNIKAWLTTKDIWVIFLATASEFTCIYLWCEVLSTTAFHIEGGGHQRRGVWHRYIRYFLMSISSQSHCGLSDEMPWNPIADFVSTLQMALGMLWNVAFIITINRKELAVWSLEEELKTKPRFAGSPGALRVVEEEEEEKDIRSPRSEQLIKRTRRVVQQGVVGWLASPCRILNTLGHFVYINCFLVVLIIQVTNAGILKLCGLSDAALWGSLLFQLLLTTMLVATSYIVTIRSKVRLSFLAQSFLCVWLGFTGVYFTLAIYKPEEFAIQLHNAYSDVREEAAGRYASLLIEFLQFSLSTLTSTGFMEIVPVAPTSHLVVVVQILASVLFKTVLIGLGTRDLGAGSICYPRPPSKAERINLYFKGDGLSPLADEIQSQLGPAARKRLQESRGSAHTLRQVHKSSSFSSRPRDKATGKLSQNATPPTTPATSPRHSPSNFPHVLTHAKSSPDVLSLV